MNLVIAFSDGEKVVVEADGYSIDHEWIVPFIKNPERPDLHTSLKMLINKIHVKYVSLERPENEEDE